MNLQLTYAYMFVQFDNWSQKDTDILGRLEFGGIQRFLNLFESINPEIYNFVIN